VHGQPVPPLHKCTRMKSSRGNSNNATATSAGVSAWPKFHGWRPMPPLHKCTRLSNCLLHEQQQGNNCSSRRPRGRSGSTHSCEVEKDLPWTTARKQKKKGETQYEYTKKSSNSCSPSDARVLLKPALTGTGSLPSLEVVATVQPQRCNPLRSCCQQRWKMPS